MADIELAVELANDTRKDQVDLLINDIYTSEFDLNGDFTKMMNSTNFNIYGVHPDDHLSFVAVDNITAQTSIALGYQVPAGGEYWLQLSDKDYVMAEAIDGLYITDHEVSPEITTNLLDEPYQFSVGQAETNDTRFTLTVKLKPQNATDVEIVDDGQLNNAEPMKFLWHEKLYILRNGVIYDATGKKVREINK